MSDDFFERICLSNPADPIKVECRRARESEAAVRERAERAEAGQDALGKELALILSNSTVGPNNPDRARIGLDVAEKLTKALGKAEADRERLRGMIDYARGAPDLASAVSILTDALDGVTGADNVKKIRGEREKLRDLLARAESWLGIGVDVEDDEDEYKLVDRLRADIRAALGEEKP